MNKETGDKGTIPREARPLLWKWYSIQTLNKEYQKKQYICVPLALLLLEHKSPSTYSRLSVFFFFILWFFCKNECDNKWSIFLCLNHPGSGKCNTPFGEMYFSTCYTGYWRIDKPWPFPSLFINNSYSSSSWRAKKRIHFYFLKTKVMKPETFNWH